jgi:MarR family transcriptional regulator, organic hydroperoxide resistance regulator
MISDIDLEKELTLDKQLCFALYGAAHAFTRAYKPLLSPLGLTYPQYVVMMASICRDDGIVGGGRPPCQKAGREGGA